MCFRTSVLSVCLFFVGRKQPQATDSLTDLAEKARCLSLLADLALIPECARTLFRGGAVPQMLLNTQGCTHVDEQASGHRHFSGNGENAVAGADSQIAGGRSSDTNGTFAGGDGGSDGGDAELGSDGLGSPASTDGSEQKVGVVPKPNATRALRRRSFAR